MHLLSVVEIYGAAEAYYSNSPFSEDICSYWGDIVK